VPRIRAFRALRFDPEVVGDLNRVICPPYDVIGPELHHVLLARHPHNAVRLDLPELEPGDGPDDRYRRAARTLLAWRGQGILRKDPRISIYMYEQTYKAPGSDQIRVQRGFFGRLMLENFGPGSGVLPHETTLAGPKEDRYKLLRATAVGTSPVVGLYSDPTGASIEALDAISTLPPTSDVTDDDGVRHRLWSIAEEGPLSAQVRLLLQAASRQPVTIADGHHRYETAIRYRDERRANKSGEVDPSSDYVMMLFLETSGQRLTVLPTHRVVRGLGPDGVTSLLKNVDSLFTVKRIATRTELESHFASIDTAPGGEGRFGLWTRDGGAILRANRVAFEPLLPEGGPALRRLDVTLLQTALSRLCGIDPAAVAAGRLAYSKSVREALDWVDSGRDGADAAFLLDPTPVNEIAAVAADGDVMPQKSTYFYPKALTGLIINAHEW
jgi:uncharacterized protein (DUF1015 family)